jgi:hydrogenase maturation factor
MATVLLPQGADSRLAEDIFGQINDACRAMNVALVGGHTEITRDLKRPLVVGCMLAEAERNNIITTGGAICGDDIVLTKGISIEGCAVLARESRNELIAAGISQKTVELAAAYLQNPGISVLKEAITAVESAEIHSMHDPTEGGLATALREVALASGNGLVLEKSSIPILPECAEICKKLQIDPLGLLASGALLITLSHKETPRLLAGLRGAGIDAAVIGRMVEAKQGVKMKEGAGIRDLPEFERDELACYLETRS